MRIFLKLEWKKGGKSSAWYTDKDPASEYMSIGAGQPRLMNEAEVGEFQRLVNRKQEQEFGAGRNFLYRVYGTVEVNYPYAIVKSAHQTVRERWPDHYRVINLQNGSESILDTHAMCHEMIRSARTKRSKGSFDLDSRP